MVNIKSLGSSISQTLPTRPFLDQMAYEGNYGRARMQELYRMLYEKGPGNGTLLSLAFDQTVEHGIGHLFKWEKAANPSAVIEIANKANFSALALPLGLAEKYQNVIRPDLPLIIKVDGHFLVGNEVDYPSMSAMGTVERAVAAGANAIGFTLYFGNENMQKDVERAAALVEAAHKMGKPVIMWAYPRGPLADRMGSSSLFWCAQAIAAGEALGVDVVKQKIPTAVPDYEAYARELCNYDGKKGYYFKKMPEIDKLLELEPFDGKVTEELHIKRMHFLAQVAPNCVKIYSGGARSDDPEKELLDSTRVVMESGNEGRIVGRNLWGIPTEQAIDLANKTAALMAKKEYRRKLSGPTFKRK